MNSNKGLMSAVEATLYETGEKTGEELREFIAGLAKVIAPTMSYDDIESMAREL